MKFIDSNTMIKAKSVVSKIVFLMIYEYSSDVRY